MLILNMNAHKLDTNFIMNYYVKSSLLGILMNSLS